MFFFKGNSFVNWMYPLFFWYPQFFFSNLSKSFFGTPRFFFANFCQKIWILSKKCLIPPDFFFILDFFYFEKILVFFHLKIFFFLIYIFSKKIHDFFKWIFVKQEVSTSGTPHRTLPSVQSSLTRCIYVYICRQQ